jgi:hypothetical protein
MNYGKTRRPGTARSLTPFANLTVREHVELYILSKGVPSEVYSKGNISSELHTVG